MFVVAACTPGDDTADGTRGLCGEGGALNDQCEEPITTARDACWRMVDCGAISVKSDNTNRFTWARCVDTLERQTADRQRLVIHCIAASSCDALKPDPQNGQIACLLLGDQ